jgi:DNA-binding LacI/PurR family transcriptional regulator
MGRPPVKRSEIADTLHRRITSQEMAPGTRLPSFRELSAEFAASLVTVQSAMNDLVAEGFVEFRGSQGTFVAERPPHIHDYALVFPFAPGSRGFTRYWQSLVRVAGELETERSCRISLWYGVDGHMDAEDYQELRRRVLRRRVAGLVFASPPFLIKDTELVTEAGIPRAAIMPEDPAYPDIVKVVIDGMGFYGRAAESLAAQGRKRVAVFLGSDVGADRVLAIRRVLQNAGLECRPYWFQQVNLDTPQSVRSCSHLMFRPGQTDQPDAVIIADDNLAPAVQLGMIDAGVADGERVAVVCHCNYPCPPEKLMPLSLLGFDVKRALHACLLAIDAQRRGEAVPAAQPLAPEFEHQRTPTSSVSPASLAMDGSATRLPHLPANL